MEFISSLCGLLCFLCILAAVVSFFVWLVLLLTKSKKKKTAKIVFLSSLAGVVLFTIIGVATFKECEHNWEIIEKTKATCSENGSSVKHCTLCDKEQEGEEIPALGHTWIETVKEATCTEQGERTKKCSTCGETTTEVIVVTHDYSETIVSEPKCETDGAAQLVCSICGDSQDKAIPATGHTMDEGKTIIEPGCEEEGTVRYVCTGCGHSEDKAIASTGHTWGEAQTLSAPKCETEGISRRTCTKCGSYEDKTIASTGHTWENATCTTPKTCSACNETVGAPIGHTTDAGVCSRCGQTVMKQSPVTVIGMRYTIDYVGGVEWTFKIRNNSDKVIKYITFQWTCYNAVGDPIRDSISGKTYVRLKFTGPLAPGETTGSKRNTTLFYNYAFASIKWNEITVEYMDGTTESITEYYEGYYQQ